MFQVPGSKLKEKSWKLGRPSGPSFGDRSEGGIDRAEPTVDGGADSDRRMRVAPSASGTDAEGGARSEQCEAGCRAPYQEGRE
ncbi:hypothetical protein Enr13x_54760 [Stieleria neptunia]|uniref:Uncharacterized protein n=1 Tax=Stieleria neptunia TaxID=2527979 RepID=A0A518HY00_9BACT|nr:hypothetical protein Enr13x_54760 [Stieleria neptunia]